MPSITNTGKLRIGGFVLAALAALLFTPEEFEPLRWFLSFICVIQALLLLDAYRTKFRRNDTNRP